MQKSRRNKTSHHAGITQPAATGCCWSSQIQVGQVYWSSLKGLPKRLFSFMLFLKQLDQLQVDSFHLRLTQYSSTQGKYSSSASGSCVAPVCTRHYKVGTKQTLVRHTLKHVFIYPVSEIVEPDIWPQVFKGFVFLENTNLSTLDYKLFLSTFFFCPSTSTMCEGAKDKITTLNHRF